MRSISAVLAIVLVLALGPTKGFGAFAATCSSSADCQQQIDNLNAQNSQVQQTVNTLQAQASSYQDAINILGEQINQIQQQIVTSQNQEDQLNAQIIQAQADLDQQKKTLGEDIKAMYLEGKISTLEMLASSNNISDFVNKQTYRNSVQNKVKDTVDKIAALKLQLQQQQAQVEQLLKTQQVQRDQLASDENQQQQLLSYNEGQQSAYNQQIQTNKSALSQLYAKQAAIIAASFGGSGIHYGGTGGYPYDGAVCLNASGDCGPYANSPYNWGINGYPYDEAGWQYRNCTSYVFWRLAQTTGITLTWNYFPTVLHNGGGIGSSLPDFRNLGYRVDHDPTGGAVLAVNTAGSFGHIMYVEDSSGGVLVSQYNAGSNYGRYSTGLLDPSQYGSGGSVWFVHIR